MQGCAYVLPGVRVRNTFLDVKEVDEDDPKLVRSRSESSLTGNFHFHSGANLPPPVPSTPSDDGVESVCSLARYVIQDVEIHNLDTGEVRAIWRADVNFVERPVNPRNLKHFSRTPWVQFWIDKRLLEERLWAAAECGNLHQLQEVFAVHLHGNAPPDVNSKSLYGRTPLHIATAVGNPDCVELLLDNKADLEARTDAGLTAFHVACQRGRLATASLLLDRGSDVLSMTNDLNLPIHLAAMNGHTDIVILLLERGGDYAQVQRCNEQLLTRNNLGQRPSEVSSDIRTAEVIRKFESHFSVQAELFRTSVCNSESGGFVPAIDHYAGRTPFYQGMVLLRNSRVDMVGRLLHKAQHLSHNFELLHPNFAMDMPPQDPPRCQRQADGLVLPVSPISTSVPIPESGSCTARTCTTSLHQSNDPAYLDQSRDHPKCKPCKWHQSKLGCKLGSSCQCCHHVDHKMEYKRNKNAIRKQKRREAANK